MLGAPRHRCPSAVQFSRIYLNRLSEHSLSADTVVVIDVLRSFTTAAVALARGARSIHAVDGVAAAAALLDRIERPVTVGAVGGGDPMPGFDFGNSPAQLEAVELAGRHVILSTAAGVRGLQRFHQAERLFAASLVCARATAEAIRQAGAREVCFVITGEWVDRDGDEDIACADYLEALLGGHAPDPAEYARRVEASDFGQRFLSGEWPNLPLADLRLACAVDRYDFPMPVHRLDGQLVILPPTGKAAQASRRRNTHCLSSDTSGAKA